MSDMYKENLEKTRDREKKNYQDKIDTARKTLITKEHELQKEEDFYKKYGWDVPSLLLDDKRKEIASIKIGIKKLEGKMRNIDKVIEFVLKYEPHTYSMCFHDNYESLFENLVREYNPDISEKIFYKVTDDIDEIIDNNGNVSLPYINYKEDLHIDTGIPIEDIPKHPWNTGVVYLRKSTVEEILELLKKYNVKIPKSKLEEAMLRVF